MTDSESRADRPGQDESATSPGEVRDARTGSVERGSEPGSARNVTEVEPCLHCGVPLSLRLYGCKGGHCPNCGHPYPHGDCSD